MKTADFQSEALYHLDHIVAAVADKPTLRQTYAAAALQGLLAADTKGSGVSAHEMVTLAFMFADKMIEAEEVPAGAPEVLK